MHIQGLHNLELQVMNGLICIDFDRCSALARSLALAVTYNTCDLELCINVEMSTRVSHQAVLAAVCLA